MTFHFLRPWWLLAIVPAVIFVILLLKHLSQANGWAKYCDSHLLEHIIVSAIGTKKLLILLVLLFILVVAIFSLAGPVWKYKDVPVYQKNI